jgi:uncharacterized protein
MPRHPDPRRFLLWCLLCCVLAAAPALAGVAVPELRARVTDLTQTLTPEQRQALEQDLADLETRQGAQVAVLIVPTPEPETIEQYARRVLDEWKLGRKGVDDGALLLVAKDDRKLRIETQYGLEGVIPDAVAKRVITEDITPAFKRSDYYGGLSAGVGRLIGLVNGEPLPPPADQGPDWSSFEDIGWLVFLGAMFFGSALRVVLGPLLGATVFGALVGGVLWVVIGSLVACAIGAVVAFLFVLLGGIGGLGGGSGGGWSSSGGGGFSGGGGSGGGGGASGSW